MILQALSKSIIIYMINTKWLLLYFEEGTRPIRKEGEHLLVSCPSAFLLEHPMMRKFLLS